MTERSKTGQFKKGVSGNPSGRPKSSNLTATDRKDFKDDPMQALLYLMNTARTKEEVFKYAKELMPYCKPKLSSIKSEIEQETTVTVKIEGFGPDIKMKEVEDDTEKTIELTEEDIQVAADKRVAELDKGKKKNR